VLEDSLMFKWDLTQLSEK